MMLEEKNRESLERAINRLPVYEPSPSVWESISDELDQAEKKSGLQESLQQLPSYSPPETVWDGIAAELESSSTRREARIRPLYRRIPWSAAAAVVLLLVGLAWVFFPDRNEAVVSIERSVVEVPEVQLAADWNEDETFFEEVEARFSEHPLLRDHPKIQMLRQELEELNAARKEIQTVMSNYGRDANLIRQMGQIERERSDVLKRMVALN